MVATSLSKYKNEKDKNDVVVSSWAVDLGHGTARCKWCDCKIIFKSGKRSLLKHSETEKHIEKSPKKDTVVHQLTISESLQLMTKNDKEKEEVARKTREFEISLVRSLSNHKVSMGFLDCLQGQLKKYCGDSAVVEAMKLHRYKGDVMLRNGISKTYQEETVQMMQDCDGFSIGFDESEVNKSSEMEIMANIAVKDQGNQLRHYRTLELDAVDSGTAASIVASLLEQLTDDGIDYKNKLFTTMTDGCNTMQGHKAGVKKLLADKVPQFVDMGSCNDHHISNALKHGVKEFDSDIQESLVHIYMDIGGAKGRGLKKKKEFEAVCDSIGLKPMPFKKFCSTRFRIIRDCIKPVLHNWEGIIKYYNSRKKPTQRQKLLKAYFVDREWLSLLKIHFVNSAIRELIEGIDYFERRSLLVHEVREKMEKILRNQILKFHNECVVKKADDALLHTVKKTGAELLDIDLDCKSTRLSRRAVFVGQEVSALLKKLSLDPKCTQLETFFEGVYKYHTTVAKYLTKYFTVGLNCTELEYMSCFSPCNANALSTAHHMKYLTRKYSKVVENIEKQEGLDRFHEEIENYTTDDEVMQISSTTKNFEDFWRAVALLTEGDASWPKLPLLPRFAMVMATAFISNSETERAFSVQTDIHRDPKRNLMLQETFDAHMQVHYGVEGQATKEKCEKCVSYKLSKSKVPHHCHCVAAEISDKMLNDTKTVWQVETNRQKLAKEAVEENQKVADAKQEATQQAATIRGLTFVNGLKTRKSFYTPELMMQVFVGNKSRTVVEDELDIVENESECNMKKKAVVSSSVDPKKKKKKRTHDVAYEDNATSAKKRKQAKTSSPKQKEVPISLFGKSAAK